MKWLIRLVLIILVAGVTWLGYATFFPTPKKAILNRINTVARLASFAPGEGSFRRIANIEKMTRYFSEDVQLVVDVPGSSIQTLAGRGELTQAAMAAKSMSNGLKVEFLDPNIDLNQGGESALVNLTLKAKPGNDSDLVVQELSLIFKKIDGEWLITHIETVKTLKP